MTVDRHEIPDFGDHSTDAENCRNLEYTPFIKGITRGCGIVASPEYGSVISCEFAGEFLRFCLGGLYPF